MKTIVERSCRACGQPFRTAVGNVTRGQRFCSIACAWVERKAMLVAALPTLRAVTYEDINQARHSASAGYMRVKLLMRSQKRDGWVDEHIAIAEVALGKALPQKAHVHHVNGNRLDNHRGNLVICQDWAYHQLLHLRQKVQRAGGNPNTDKVCCDCGAVKPFAQFARSSAAGILHPRCKPCAARTLREQRAARKTTA